MSATATAAAMVDPTGRLVIPSKIRSELGIEGGGEVIMTLRDGQLQIYSKVSARKAARQAVQDLVAEGESLADELSSERQAEAQIED